MLYMKLLALVVLGMVGCAHGPSPAEQQRAVERQRHVAAWNAACARARAFPAENPQQTTMCLDWDRQQEIARQERMVAAQERQAAAAQQLADQQNAAAWMQVGQQIANDLQPAQPAPPAPAPLNCTTIDTGVGVATTNCR